MLPHFLKEHYLQPFTLDNMVCHRESRRTFATTMCTESIEGGKTRKYLNFKCPPNLCDVYECELCFTYCVIIGLKTGETGSL